MTDQNQTSERSLDALDYIAEHVRRHGYPPTRAEVAEHLGATSTTVGTRAVRRLVNAGLVVSHGPRAISITEAGMKALGREMT